MGHAASSDAPLSLGSGAMFDRIAPRYDFLNRVLSLGIDQSWRTRAARSLELGSKPSPRVLDLATGTADLAIRIATLLPTATVLGTDPSAEMLRIGREKIVRRALSPRVELVRGDAQAIEVPDASFDGATIAFGIRNVPDRDLALREMRRVVRPGGRVVVLELGEPRVGILGPIARFHVRVLVPRIGALLSGAREYRYLQSSIAAFPAPEVFVAQMERAGLVDVSAQPLTFGACTLYAGRVA
jgi:demethylmenaquinone methyltransferase / 2-methoxy-6-polyprenyl-1,4-benzoquinol methylase